MKDGFVHFHHFGNNVCIFSLFSMVFMPVLSLFQKKVTKDGLIFGREVLMQDSYFDFTYIFDYFKTLGEK